MAVAVCGLRQGTGVAAVMWQHQCVRRSTASWWLLLLLLLELHGAQVSAAGTGTTSSEGDSSCSSSSSSCDAPAPPPGHMQPLGGWPRGEITGNGTAHRPADGPVTTYEAGWAPLPAEEFWRGAPQTPVSPRKSCVVLCREMNHELMCAPLTVVPVRRASDHIGELQPALFKGMARASPAWKLWTDDYLEEHFGEQPVKLEYRRENRTCALIIFQHKRGADLTQMVLVRSSDYCDQYKLVYKEGREPVKCPEAWARWSEQELWKVGLGDRYTQLRHVLAAWRKMGGRETEQEAAAVAPSGEGGEGQGGEKVGSDAYIISNLPSPMLRDVIVPPTFACGAAAICRCCCVPARSPPV